MRVSMNLVGNERAYGGAGGSQERNEICEYNTSLLLYVNFVFQSSVLTNLVE